jgi:hypothetical protein
VISVFGAQQMEAFRRDVAGDSWKIMGKNMENT